LHGISNTVLKYKFFSRLRNHYEQGSGEDFLLTQNEFKYLIGQGKIDYENATPIDDKYYEASIDFYNSDRDLKLSFGRATVTYRIENNQYVHTSFYDRYDFDSKPWGTRTYKNEIITRAYNTISNGTPFGIYFNKYHLYCY
jgi:hypothetical protein